MRPLIRRLGSALAGLALIMLPAMDTSVWAQSPPGVGAAIDDVVAANRILYRQGVVDGFGHISIRHPDRKDRFLMSASLAPGRVSQADIMEFDLDAQPIDQRGRSIYSERFIHSEIYKARPDVNAVLHSHSPTVIPFSVSQVPMRPMLNSAGFLAPNVPVFEMRHVAGSGSLLVTDGMRGRALAETLGDRPVALMRGHGNVVVGPTVQRVVARAIYTEVNARQLSTALSFRKPIKYIEPYEMLDPQRLGDSWEVWKRDAMRKA